MQGRKISGAIVLMAVMGLMGCSGMSAVGYPLATSAPKEEWKYRVMRTVSDPHAFSASAPRSWMEICEGTTDPKKIQDLSATQRQNGGGHDGYAVEYFNCTVEGDILATPTTGYLDGLGKAMMYTGAALGSSAILADGIRDSGSTTIQSGGGASQSQTQGQVQGSRRR